MTAVSYRGEDAEGDDCPAVLEEDELPIEVAATGVEGLHRADGEDEDEDDERDVEVDLGALVEEEGDSGEGGWGEVELEVELVRRDTSESGLVELERVGFEASG